MVQMGKDVVTFLSWAAEPEMEERKLVHFALNPILFLSLLLTIGKVFSNSTLGVWACVNADGIQMDICTLTCATPSWLLPTLEVVSSQVSQAGPGRRQLASPFVPLILWL